MALSNTDKRWIVNETVITVFFLLEMMAIGGFIITAELGFKSMYLFAAVVVFSFIMVMIYPRKQKGGERK